MKRARDIREQLLGLMERTEVELTSDPGNHEAIKKALAAGFFYHTASLQKTGTYRTVKSPQTVHIHPSSGLREVCSTWGSLWLWNACLGFKSDLPGVVHALFMTLVEDVRVWLAKPAQPCCRRP